MADKCFDQDLEFAIFRFTWLKTHRPDQNTREQSTYQLSYAVRVFFWLLTFNKGRINIARVRNMSIFYEPFKLYSSFVSRTVRMISGNPEMNPTLPLFCRRNPDDSERADGTGEANEWVLDLGGRWLWSGWGHQAGDATDMSIIFREYDRKVFCLCHTMPIRTGFGEEDIFENSRTYMYNYTYTCTVVRVH